MFSPIKKTMISVFMQYRLLTASLRTLPDFIILGGQRCGTTSLYTYLKQHPCIVTAVVKETHFFDLNFHRGIHWYKRYFPTRFRKNYFIKKRKIFITGESSPYYIFHPCVPERIKDFLPKVKFLVLLRNPVDRAYSHYHHEARKGREFLSFTEAIERETQRLDGEFEKIMEDERYASFNHRRYSYLSRGRYVEQLEHWFRYFSREQFLILKSEDFYRNPKEQMKRVFNFLGLPNWELKRYDKYNYAQDTYNKMSREMRQRLHKYFESYNQRLYKLLDRDLAWENDN